MGVLRRSPRVAMVVAAGLTLGGGLVALPRASGAASPTYYLSLGDSYSVGYQPNPITGGTGAASSGYTGLVAIAKGYTLENFGCGGATTASLLSFPEAQCGINTYGPPAIAGTVGPSSGSESQVQAADAFIAAHPNQIGLITVSIGGNDVTPCVAAAPGNPVNGATNAIACVAAALGPISTNVTTAAVDLRNALIAADGKKAGKKVRIIGLTYPDVLLGLEVNSGPGGTPPDTPTATPSTANLNLAAESVLAFKSYINPELKTAYKAGHAKFINVTKKTKGYLKSKRLVSMDIPSLGLGTIKVTKPVYEICTLTWFCQFANIHANTAGYTLIGNLIVKADRTRAGRRR